MQKSVVVAVDQLFHNKLYNPYVKRTSKLRPPRSSRPLSRHKRWVVSEILKRARIYKPPSPTIGPVSAMADAKPAS